MTTETKEISVLSKEQIETLPKESLKPVKALNDSLKKEQLKIFVPVVNKYMELRESAFKLKLERKDGEITKESIQAYKDLKKDVGSFNSLNTKEIKKLKEPFNGILKDIRDVEKSFKAESDKIKEAAIKEFKEYEDEVARKKKEAEDRKNAKLLAEVEANKKAALELQEKSLKVEAVNNIKYKEIAENITEAASNAVNNLNEASIKTLKQSLSILTFEDVKSKHDVSAIDEDTLKELEAKFDSAKKNADILLTDKLTAIDNERKLQATSSPVYSAPEIPETPAPKVPEAPQPPVPPAEFRAQLSDVDFLTQIKGQINSIASELELRIGGGCTNAEIIQLYSNLKSIKL